MAGRLVDYMGQGLDADLPVAADMIPLITSGGLALYYAYDVPKLYIWNSDTVAWEPPAAGVTEAPNDGTPYVRQSLGWVAGFTTEAIQDLVAAMMVNGTGVTVTYDDVLGTLTVATTITQYTDEMARDALGAALTNGAGITITPNDGADTITIACTITQYTNEMAQDAVGNIMTNGRGITVTYDDAGNTVTVATADPAIQSVASAATVTPTFSNDSVNITAQAAGLTLANPTGTTIDNWGMVIRIKDNGTARAISYGTQYRAIGVTLPTTTVVSKTLYLGMIYNATDTKWDVVAVAQEA